MVKVDNKKTIHALTVSFMRSYKKSTLTVLLAVSLIITLVVSLFTLIHTNHRIEAQQNLFIYTNIDYEVKGLNLEQAEKLKERKEMEKLGIRQVSGTVTADNSQSASIVSANETSILAVSRLLEGKMPEAENEIVAEKWTLLNLGINPVIGTEVTFPANVFATGRTEEKTYKITGVINDITLNKLSGSMNLYTGLAGAQMDELVAEVKWKDGVNAAEEMQRAAEELNIPQKSISPNPWKENTTELVKTDFEMGLLLTLICFVIVWGIYRIALIKRESQYSILRAVGVTKEQVGKMIRAELLLLYLVSIPIGFLLGAAGVCLITYFSKDNENPIYFWGVQEPFRIVFPVIPVLVCIAAVGAMMLLIAWMGYRKTAEKPVISGINGAEGTEGKRHRLFTIKEKDPSRFLAWKLGGKYIFSSPKTTLMIILSLTVGGSLFYGLAYRADLAKSLKEIKTKENFYNSDYMLTAYNDMDAAKGITGDTVKKAQEIPGITGMEAQMAMPVKVLDDGTKRLDDYLDGLNERVGRIYGFTLKNSSGGDAVYQTKLKGYNKTALEKLENYLVEGTFDPEHMKEDEVIVAMPRMSEYGKSKGTVGFFKNGLPLISYEIGQTITLKYRTDFDTDAEEYWQCTDQDAAYTEKRYKVAAIVYYPYMQQVSVLEKVYPLLITSEEYFKKLSPADVYETVHLNTDGGLGKEKEAEIEQELIRLSVENKGVTARSLIEEKAKLDMLYQKEMVYIYGIAAVAFILILVNLVNSLKYRMQTRKMELFIYKAVGMDIRFQSRMILFENMIFGAVSLAAVWSLSRVIAKYLYTGSEIYIYGITYQYNYVIFLLLAAATLLLCYAVTRGLNRQLRKDRVVDELNKLE